ncbi:hypothetical protein RRG08_022252 [Elysia crispata]|uniref:Nidogen n=1 Tax=Elysia crispata TaxID=231223 RepID=A0AAE0ZQ59_9GAST|nr:hypothetical protein RRG08_022252 [Elysia crispata]
MWKSPYALASSKMVAVSIALLLVLPSIQAVSMNIFFPYGRSNLDNILEPGDDRSSMRFVLKEPIVFYNISYDSFYVNMNGHVSFGAEVPEYRPDRSIPLGLDTPLIAVFLADVDTTRSGTVYYRWTQRVETLNRATAEVTTTISGFPMFKATMVYIITWENVGYYKAKGDKQNTFQLVLITDGKNSFCLFYYLENGIQWKQSEGKNFPNKDIMPQAGFDGGRRGLSYTLIGSGETGEFVNGSNINLPGAWIFQIGDVGSRNVRSADFQTGDVTVFDVETGEDNSYCLQGSNTCHKLATCIDYRSSYCCRCTEPFTGNGIYCIDSKLPQKLNGEVSGRVNGLDIRRSKMHTYIDIANRGTYTTIYSIPKDLATAMETLTFIGAIGGWMFTPPKVEGIKNGFMVAGSKFNVTSEVTFTNYNGETHVIRTHQTFQGHNDDSRVNVMTRIEGSLPEIPYGSNIGFDSYYRTFTKIAPGTIKSTVNRVYRVNRVGYRYRWESTIMYEECQEDAKNGLGDMMTLHVERLYAHLLNTSKAEENIVRFATVNAIISPSGANPCQNAVGVCHEKAVCIPMGDDFKCACKAGYTGDGKTCTDIDECQYDSCGPNSRCYNVMGAFQCQCHTGYVKDGNRCKAQTCKDADICSDNAQCVYDPILEEHVCECMDEFSGDGYNCESAMAGYSSCEACDRYALCTADETTGRYFCECRPGFTGDGTRCDIIENCRSCDRYATCEFDVSVSDYQCVCRRGYKGDGETCEQQDCREDTSMCHPEGGLCWLDTRRNFSFCRCNYGYQGDGFDCRPVGCDKYNYCSRYAQCLFNGQSHVCTCNDGYSGDGKTCRRERPTEPMTCRERCDANAMCVRDQEGRFYCRCNRGYEGDGRRCRRIEPTAEPTTCRERCDVNARCVRDQGGRYSCRCNRGYEGDGTKCRQTEAPCNQVDNCHSNAECLYNPDVAAYQCRCSRGYEGDGTYCRRKQINDCRRDPRLCSSYADCRPGRDEAYVCVCQPGYRGDGARCDRVVTAGNSLVYAQGNKIMRVSADELSGDNGQIIAYEQGMLAVGVEVDCKEGDVYWTDAAKGVIKKSKLDGTDMKNVINGMKSPEGIAIDFVARNMFFTDSEMDSLMVAKLDGTDVKTLVSTEMANPRAVVLDISRAVVYWTDWNRNLPQIERINMDGTDRNVLVQEDIRLPNGLAFDPYSQTLCWGDAGTKKIECIRSNGAGRRVIFENAMYPFDIAMLNNVIYWTDWKMREIPNVNQNGGGENRPLKQVMGGNGRTYGISAVVDRCPRAQNSCGRMNGGCKYLCLPQAGGGRTCECPDGMDPRLCQE